jgi:hypothetical protein
VFYHDFRLNLAKIRRGPGLGASIPYGERADCRPGRTAEIASGCHEQGISTRWGSTDTDPTRRLQRQVSCTFWPNSAAFYWSLPGFLAGFWPILVGCTFWPNSAGFYWILP